jgi:hypothetical protein
LHTSVTRTYLQSFTGEFGIILPVLRLLLFKPFKPPIHSVKARLTRLLMVKCFQWRKSLVEDVFCVLLTCYTLQLSSSIYSRQCLIFIGTGKNLLEGCFLTRALMTIMSGAS